MSKAERRVVRQDWWLDPTGFPSLFWARLRVFSDGTAEVLDLDGVLLQFPSEELARNHLLEDEYERAESIEDEDLEHGGLTRNELVPPSGETDSELVPQMLVRRSSTPMEGAG